MEDIRTEKLLAFIQKSPTAFQAVETMGNMLSEEGYMELSEGERWHLKRGQGYFVSRNHSSLIAFFIPQEDPAKFHIIASHSDSPAFKIKEKPEITVEGAYVKLNVEKYGGMIMSSWFDRPLSAAGRLVVRDGDSIQEKLVNVDRDLLLIPSLAIHMNREVNSGYSFNVQKDLLPLYGGSGAEGSFWDLIAGAAGVKKEDILGHDLFLYSRMPGTIWGAQREFVSCGRLDDLQCAFSSLEGFLSGEKKNSIAVHCVLDNEEVGSGTRQGAAATFLMDTLLRICRSLGMDYEDYVAALSKSFMISADNAHALHPNYPEKADPVNHPVLNGGIVIKYNADQKYCTDAVSAAYLKMLCERAQVPYQTFVNRSDIAGGSTLGNISGTRVAVPTADVGLPQLAMHSCCETAGVKDTDYFVRMAQVFFE